MTEPSQAESCLASVLVKAVTDILIEITSGTILSQIPRGQLEYLVDQCREIERQAERRLARPSDHVRRP